MCQYFRPVLESTPQPTIEIKWFTSEPLTLVSTPPAQHMYKMVRGSFEGRMCVCVCEGGMSARFADLYSQHQIGLGNKTNDRAQTHERRSERALIAPPPQTGTFITYLGNRAEGLRPRHTKWAHARKSPPSCLLRQPRCRALPLTHSGTHLPLRILP